MSRFNAQLKIAPKTSGISSATPNTTNLAGGEAYSLPLRHEIAMCVLNSMLNERYYATAQDGLTQIQSLIDRADKANDLEFVAKAAVYARHVHGLRTVASMIAGELGDRGRGEKSVTATSYAKNVQNASWRKLFYEVYPQRPDDIVEAIAYWNARHPGERHPNAMTRGFAKALKNFDAYALSKYNSAKGKDVNLYDVINVTHPKAPQGHAIHALKKETLTSSDTWEKKISAAGRSATVEEAEAKTAAEWTRLLDERKLGYVALLRNLRNIAEQAPAALDKALERLVDASWVLKARIFPFQFRRAYDVGLNMPAPHGRRIQLAVMKAADIALANVPKLEGKSLVVVDDSGSMTSGQAATGDGSCIEIASIFAAALVKALPDCDYMQFSNSARYMQVDTVGMGTFALADKIKSSASGGGTNFVSIFETANKAYDRIIILSDMQSWKQAGVQQAFANYCARVGRTSKKTVTKLYTFDLTGHGTAQFPTEQVCCMAGFSEKVFSIMGQMEHDKDALVNAIAAFDLKSARRKPKDSPQADEKTDESHEQV